MNVIRFLDEVYGHLRFKEVMPVVMAGTGNGKVDLLHKMSSCFIPKHYSMNKPFLVST